MKKQNVTSTDAEVDQSGALSRGLMLLRVIAHASSPLSNRALTDATGIPKPTVSRLTATLVAHGYLRRLADSERFTLGPGLMDLNAAYLRNFDLRDHARPHLALLADLCGCSVHICVEDGLDMLVIDTFRPHAAALLSHVDVGSRMTIATSAAGRAYLATLSTAERERTLARIREASPGSWATLLRRIEASNADYARDGYAASFVEWNPHINAIAVGLRTPRREVYAISCGGPAPVLPPSVFQADIAPRLLAAVRALRFG